MKLYSIITFRNFFTQVYATLFDVIELSRPHTLGIVMDSYIRQIKRVLTEMIKFVSRIESFIVEYTLTSAGVSQKKRSSTDVSANDCFNKLFDTLLTYNSLWWIIPTGHFNVNHFAFCFFPLKSKEGFWLIAWSESHSKALSTIVSVLLRGNLDTQFSNAFRWSELAFETERNWRWNWGWQYSFQKSVLNWE